MSLTDSEREELQEFRRQSIGQMMRDISEDCWASGWNMGLEADLYRIVFEGASPEYGMGWVSTFEREKLRQRAMLANCWYAWSDERKDAVPISLEEARSRYRGLPTEGAPNPDALP